NLEVFAYFNVSESDYLDLVEHDSETAQQQVELVMANQQVHPFKGVIETVEGEVDKATGNIAFRARFKNPDLTLKHGSTGKIRLIKEIKNAMMIPQKATVEIQDALYVFRVDEQNRIHLQNVKPAMRIPHLYILESGLAPSDRIIFEGVQRVRDGDRIEPDLVPVGSIRTQTAGA
ncbi:MAG: efflux RND transporter periplasmic adaptor subunit, partial [Bacteroidota bacterium]